MVGWPMILHIETSVTLFAGTFSPTKCGTLRSQHSFQLWLSCGLHCARYNEYDFHPLRIGMLNMQNAYLDDMVVSNWQKHAVLPPLLLPGTCAWQQATLRRCLGFQKDVADSMWMWWAAMLIDISIDALKVSEFEPCWLQMKCWMKFLQKSLPDISPWSSSSAVSPRANNCNCSSLNCWTHRVQATSVKVNHEHHKHFVTNYIYIYIYIFCLVNLG